MSTPGDTGPRPVAIGRIARLLSPGDIESLRRLASEAETMRSIFVALADRADADERPTDTHNRDQLPLFGEDTAPPPAIGAGGQITLLESDRSDGLEEVAAQERTRQCDAVEHALRLLHHGPVGPLSDEEASFLRTMQDRELAVARRDSLLDSLREALAQRRAALDDHAC